MVISDAFIRLGSTVINIADISMVELDACEQVQVDSTIATVNVVRVTLSATRPVNTFYGTVHGSIVLTFYGDDARCLRMYFEGKAMSLSHNPGGPDPDGRYLRPGDVSATLRNKPGTQGGSTQW